MKKDTNSLQTRTVKLIPRDDLQATVSGAMMSKVTAKMKENSSQSSLEPHNPIDASSMVSSEEDSPEDGSSDPVTDIDGWVYSDNKWEKQTSKGGYNKVNPRRFSMCTH